MSYVNNEMITNALNGMPVHEILNAVRDEASEFYQRNVTEASINAISATGAGINSNPALQNEFLRLLVTGVIPIAFSRPELYDDFTIFRGERIPVGKTLMETATDVIDPIEFDMYASEFTEKEIFVPKVSTRFYVKNREDQFPLTISRVKLQSAFDDETSFMNFVRSLIDTLHASNERAKYNYTLATLENYYDLNKYYILEANNILSGVASDAENFIEQVERLTLEMGLGDGSREFNNQGLVTRTSADKLHLFITPAMMARFKLGVWAKVFNLSEAEFRPNVHVIRGFKQHPEIQAILCDEEFFRIHPQFEQMTEAINARGLYSTYYFTCFDTYALSDFKNAIVIVDENIQNTVYDVVIPVSNADIRRGTDVDYEAIVRQVARDTEKHNVVWSVSAPVGSVAKSPQTTFKGNTLTIAENEPNSMLNITATVTVTGEASGEEAPKSYDVVGMASVNVVK